MKIVSYNINGIRSANSKGIFDWIDNLNADIICIQEVRANENVVNKLLNLENNQISFFDSNLFLNKYHVILNCGQVAGYAGTLIITKQKPNLVRFGLPNEEDYEGRLITAFYDNFAVVNCYVPNGATRLDFKLEYFKKLTNYLHELTKTTNVILCSDLNIAHTELDLTHPKECSVRSGFLPVERELVTTLLNNGFIDIVRHFNNDNLVITWRSYKSRALTDKTFSYGWKYRFDYILANNALKNNLISCDIPDLIYSDHLPVICEININF